MGGKSDLWPISFQARRRKFQNSKLLKVLERQRGQLTPTNLESCARFGSSCVLSFEADPAFAAAVAHVLYRSGRYFPDCNGNFEVQQ